MTLKEYTPEEIALNLILDKPVGDTMLVFSTDDSYETLFELLITIYIEMIINYLNLNNSDLTKLNLLMISNINNKFLTLKYNVNMININKDLFDEIKKNRYCNILLKYSQEIENRFFYINTDIDKKYHFILNYSYKTNDNLKNIFATVLLNNVYYKISFTKL
jgi:hypothetical protein